VSSDRLLLQNEKFVDDAGSQTTIAIEIFFRPSR
jgi:hypothetical protein